MIIISANRLKDIIYLNLHEIKYMLNNLLNHDVNDNTVIKFDGIKISTNDGIYFIFKSNDIEYVLPENELLTPDQIICNKILESLPDNFEIYSIIRHIDIEKNIHAYDFILMNIDSEEFITCKSITVDLTTDFENIYKKVLKKAFEIINIYQKDKKELKNMCFTFQKNSEFEEVQQLDPKERPGKLLKAARLRADLSQQLLASLAGCLLTDIQDYESNKVRMTDFMAENLANILHTDKNYFIYKGE